MKKKRLLVLANTLVGGGAEKQLLLNVRGLAAAGVDCRVYGLSPLPEHARYAALLESCRLAGVRLTVPRHRVGASLVILKLCAAALINTSSVLWLWGFRAQAIRLLCPCLWIPPCVVALRSASKEEARRHARLLRLGFPLTRLYLANSHRGVAEIAEVMPGISAKAKVVYNALEDELLAPMSPRSCRHPLRLVMLGNVRYYVKGYDFAIELARQLKKQQIPAKIVVGGSQYPREPSLADEIKRAGLADTIEWIGPVVDIRSFLEDGDMFLLLSRYEGTPNALLEAMALGLPCIASDVGDIRRFAEDGAGLAVVGIGDLAAVLFHIRGFLAQPDSALERGRRAHEYCRQHFSEKSMIAETYRALFP